MANIIFAVQIFVSFIPNIALNWIFSFELSLSTLDLMNSQASRKRHRTQQDSHIHNRRHKPWAHFTYKRSPADPTHLYTTFCLWSFHSPQRSSPASSCCMYNVALSHYGHPFKNVALLRGHSGEILMVFSCDTVASSETLLHKEIRPLWCHLVDLLPNPSLRGCGRHKF